MKVARKEKKTRVSFDLYRRERSTNHDGRTDKSNISRWVVSTLLSNTDPVHPTWDHVEIA